MNIGNLNIDGNLFSAPLAGISDSVFRTLCREYGASATVSEMVSAQGLKFSDKKTRKYLFFTDKERPIGIQLFGPDPDSALRGLEKALEVNPDFIDFNLGCPVRKVIKQGSGAALLQNPELAAEIIKTMVKNSPIPVTAKMRSGWDSSSIVFPELSLRLQDVGVSAIFIHPRTVAQGFCGEADRGLVCRTKPKLKVPVIYSGDIRSPGDAGDVVEHTGSDGIMIGRAAMGDPSIFHRVRQFFETGEIIPAPTPPEKIDMLLDHHARVKDRYGDDFTVKYMRKFIVWYTHQLPRKSELRRELFNLSDCGEVITRLKEYRSSLAS
ncbi:MAG: tRNA dihydrouridine synthase DusB [candidate division Zixibacteria bacterium]|nr:tRNA dihydrouridine synthase DusB [candidate division Zixibacteria bacterium]